MVSSGTPDQVQRVMAAMMTMQKFDVAALQAAYDG
jgi:predicted 3-demethylubiquinone-9 3-methyltransferase (glyoxalase superfamily)